MKEKIKFYDTNVLLHNDIYKIKGKIFLSSVTLQELEHIKTSRNKDDEVKYNARIATRFFKDNPDKYECIIAKKEHYELLEEKNLEVDNDNLIIACAYSMLNNYDVEFMTGDICCYNIAKNIFGLTCNNISIEQDNYKGYKEIIKNTNDINNIFKEYYVDKNNILKLEENEYLIIKNSDTNKENEYVYSHEELKLIKLPPSNVIKGMNAKQRCALDLLNNNDIPIKVIAGVYGSGKTMLSVKSALYQLKDKGKYSKIFILRNPIGSGEQVGYLPGTKEDKTKDFYAPIVDNLDGGEFELEDLKQKGYIDHDIPYFIKGRTFNETFVLCDECEDLDKKTFKLIGTRLGEKSSIAYIGDWKQAEKKYETNNGLKSFIDFAKGNPLVGIIVLDDDVRSNASKLFCDFE